MFYDQHKPRTEETIANLELIQRDFWTHINSYYQKYNFVQTVFPNHQFYQQALNFGVITSQATYSTEMIELAFSINGFINNIYQSLNYAIGLWFDNKGLKLNKKKSESKYKEGIKKFYKANEGLFENPTKERQIMQELRYGRNFFTHYGRVITIGYIFENSQIVFNAICNILAVLKEQISFNEESYQAFLDNKDEFMEALSCLGKNYSQGLYLVG